MAKVARTLDNLFDGVSRRPQAQRLPSHADEQTNALSLYNFSLARRPPMEHLAKIMSTTTGYADAFVEEIRRSDDEQYIFIIINGDLKAFNIATGAEVTVQYPDGKTYLTAATAGFRSVTIGENTVIANRSKVTAKGTGRSAAATKEALLYVRQGDYKTKYTVTLDSHTVTHETAATGRELIATDYIATQLRTLMIANTAINANFTVTQFGSTLHVVNKALSDFTVTAKDGLGDAALIAIKGTVQRFSDLPVKAKPGFTVEIKGDDTTAYDNYFVQYQEANSPSEAGTWTEVVEPNTLVELDKATMPHTLEYQGNLLSMVASETQVAVVPTLTAGSHVNGTPEVTGQILVFYDSNPFPPGASVSVKLTAGSVTDTFTFANATGAWVSSDYMCDGLGALVDASANWVVSTLIGFDSDAFEVWGAVDVPFTAVPSVVYDTTTRFARNATIMTASAHIGHTVRNLTDGSSATILSNTTVSLVTTAALTGGKTNRFNAGDIISISDTATTYFTFGQLNWPKRKAGSLKVVPYPSFVGKPINDVFEHQGRVGLLSGPNGCLTQAGSFNLFRQTATQLLADDVIDFKSALSSSPSFDSARNWNGTLLLKSDEGLFEMRGEPVLTPTTVSLTKLADYQSLPSLAPAVLGSSAFFVGMRSNVPIVWDLRIRGQEQKALAEDTTHHVPAYIDGVPLQLEVDDTSSILFLRTDDDLGVFYVYVCHYEGGEKVQSAWSKWDVGGDAQIVSINSIRGRLLVTTKHSDGIYLHSIVLDTSENPAALLNPITAWWCDGAYAVGSTPAIM